MQAASLDDPGFLARVLVEISVPEIVSKASRTSRHWNSVALGDDLWKQYLRKHARRSSFLGIGGLDGLYFNHVLYGASGLEGRIRHAKWGVRDKLTAPPTRGESKSKPAPELASVVPWSVSLPSPVATVCCSADQVAALTVRGDLFAWRAEIEPQKSPARPLSVPGVGSKTVTVLSEFGATVTEDSEFWCFCVDKTGSPVSHRTHGGSQQWLHLESLEFKSFKARPGICAAVSTEGELYTWSPDRGHSFLGRPGDHSAPLRVPFPEGVEILDVALGQSQVAVVSAAGQVFAWGNGEHGGLGQGSRAFQNSELSAQGYVELEPVLLEDLASHKVVKVDASGQYTHFAALTDSGQVWQWGGATSVHTAHYHHPTCAAQLIDHKILELSCVDDCTIARSDRDMFLMHFPPHFREDDKQKYFALPASGGTIEALPWTPLSLQCTSSPNQPQVAVSSFAWAAVGVYTCKSRMWRMAVQSKLFEDPPMVEAGWELAHQHVLQEREEGQWNRAVLLGKLRHLGLDVSNEWLVERIATKYAGDMFSDPHDPEYLTRVADHLVHYQIYGDTDFDPDNQEHVQATGSRLDPMEDDDDDFFDDSDLLRTASAHVSEKSMRVASLSVFKETGYKF